MFTRNSIVLSNNIKTPLTAISKAIGSNGILKYSYNFDEIIRQIFSHQEQGFAYDPNDLTTLYQDAAGSIPVTAEGQPVGLMLDKSKGLLLGDELVSAENSTFANGTGDWIAYDSSISTVDGALLVDAQNTNGRAGLSLTGLKVGQAYVVSCDARAGTSSAAQITLDFNGVVYTTESTLTPLKGIFFALTSDAALFVLSGTPGTFYIDNVSVKELAGNHAIQNSSSMRPLLVANPQRLDYDAVDDKLTTNLPTELTGCTVIRSVPNVGTQILTNQTIPTTYNDNINNCGLIVINRALTASETSQITQLFNKAAGV